MHRAKLAKRIITHGLRHTFASHLAMHGASLKAAQELLGRESIVMRLRYSRLTPDVKREAYGGATGLKGRAVVPDLRGTVRLSRPLKFHLVPPPFSRSERGRAHVGHITQPAPTQLTVFGDHY